MASQLLTDSDYYSHSYYTIHFDISLHQWLLISYYTITRIVSMASQQFYNILIFSGEVIMEYACHILWYS